MKKEKIIKIIKYLIKYCFYVIIFICLMYNIIYVLYTTITQKEYIELFGVSFFNMKTDLMSGDINKNSLVIMKKVDENNLKIGDIIAYQVNAKVRINKIINNDKEYTTKSNLNFYPDIEKIPYNQIIGKKVAIISNCGFFCNILQSKVTTLIILIFLCLKFLYYRYLEEQRKVRNMKKNRK